jgi:hypothetical protein
MIDQALEDLQLGIDRLKADLAKAQAEAERNREELRRAIDAWWDLWVERNELRKVCAALLNADGCEPEEPDYLLLEAREHDRLTATADAEAEADYILARQDEM